MQTPASSHTPRPTLRARLSPGRPLIVAHRGLSGLCPENTMSAFREALDAGAEMLELDVQLSRDGGLIVLHDAELERTTNGRGLAAELTTEELRALDAGSWFGARFAGERLPLLEEVLELARDRALLNVEIKAEAVSERTAGGVVERTIAAIRDARMADAVLLSSFEPRALAQAREVDPEVARASLFDAATQGGLSPSEILRSAGSCSFHLGRDEVTPGIVAECHGQGAAVLVYTVNDPGEMESLFAMGVDGVFTDRVDLGLELLRRE